ncbi:MOSC N-terminal beta barrel domain-containing protein [Nonomuraea sp. NPDC050643]|uniref:MOSC domain-containing protein n=1 Tax=Nonomuraea sp. NPDC050643 TaxID=3155660 RepID=UPI0033F6BB25
MRLVDIRIYPVKSSAGCPLPDATVEPWGLAGDRRWAVVDEAGGDLWLAEHPRLASVHAQNTDDDGLLLAAAGLPDLKVPPATGGPVPVGFPGLDHAIAAGDDAHAWFTRLLGRPVRLVWLDDPRRRAIEPSHGGLPGEVLSFAGDAPLLLTSAASLRLLDEQIGGDTPLDMARFRPSVVIDGAEPYAEDSWSEVTIGEVRFRVSELCDRCAVTTIDPVTLVKGKEPLRTLARHRRWDGRTWFGIRLVPRDRGRLRVGDPVRASGRPDS